MNKTIILDQKLSVHLLKKRTTGGCYEKHY